MSDIVRGLRDSVIVVLLTAVLIWAVFISGLSLIGIFICGIPAACFAAKYKIKFSVPVLAAIFVVVFLFLQDVLFSVEFLLLMIVPGAVAGYMLGEKKPFFSILLAVSVSVSLGFILGFYMINRSVDDGISVLFDGMKANMETALIQSLPQTNGDEITSIVSELTEITVNTIRQYIPAYIVVIAAMLGYAVLRLCGFFVRICGTSTVEIVPFSMMKAPRSMSIIAVLCYLISFFSTGESGFGGVVANAALVLEFILGVCGISYIDYLFKRKIGFTVLRWLIYMFVLVILFVTMLFPVVSCVFVIIGILDAGRDFRKIGVYENK